MRNSSLHMRVRVEVGVRHLAAELAPRVFAISLDSKVVDQPRLAHQRRNRHRRRAVDRRHGVTVPSATNAMYCTSTPPTALNLLQHRAANLSPRRARPRSPAAPPTANSARAPAPVAVRPRSNTHSANSSPVHPARAPSAQTRISIGTFRSATICSHHQRLLIILAAKERDIGRHDLKQLQHHRGHAAKMIGPILALQLVPQRTDVDRRGVARRIHLLDRRCKHQIATAAAQAARRSRSRSRG